MTIYNYILENFNLVILYTFMVSLFIQLLYYLVIYSRLAFYKKKKRTKKIYPVSVIICAKNEEQNLSLNLPSILSQEYPEYEVIVVNDCSTDNTNLILGDYMKNFKHLRTTEITEDKKFKHGKKLALTVGIKSAKYEHLVFTDADCIPESNKWLRLIGRNYTENRSIVLGYGPYHRKFGLLNNYIRYDTLTTGIQYLSYACAGIPYMGVGRNMAYTKTLFFRNKGFASHYHILSGDDDLFINETAKRSNVSIEIEKGSKTYSNAETRLISWIRQKKRHLSTAKYYKGKHKFLLGLEPFSRLLYYSSLMYLLVIVFRYETVVIAASVRFLSQLIIYKRAINKLNERNLLISSFLFDVFSLFINFILYVSNKFQFNKTRWK